MSGDVAMDDPSKDPANQALADVEPLTDGCLRFACLTGCADVSDVVSGEFLSSPASPGDVSHVLDLIGPSKVKRVHTGWLVARVETERSRRWTRSAYKFHRNVSSESLASFTGDPDLGVALVVAAERPDEALVWRGRCYGVDKPRVELSVPGLSLQDEVRVSVDSPSLVVRLAPAPAYTRPIASLDGTPSHGCKRYTRRVDK